MDLQTYAPMGDKENSAFFDEYVTEDLRAAREERARRDRRRHARRRRPGRERRRASTTWPSWRRWGPTGSSTARLLDTHKIYVLQSRPEFPRLIVLEPLSPTYEDGMTQWNKLYPLAARKPNARYVGEIYAADSVSAVREALEPQNIRFVYDGDSPNGFYAREHLDVHVPVGLHVQPRRLRRRRHRRPRRARARRRVRARPDEQEKLDAGRRAAGRARHHGPGARARPHGDPDPRRRPRGRDPRVPDDGPLLLLGRLQHHGDELVDERHAASRHRRRQEVAGAGVHGEQHAGVRELVREPADADRGLRPQLRPADAPHGATPSRTATSSTRRTSTTSCASWPRWGPSSSPTSSASARTTRTSSRSSPRARAYSMLITEYIERCHHYEGFFTRDNVASLTAAAGADERYEHGHVFD